MPDREIHAISANLLEAMRFFGRARIDGDVRECPGVSLISCGLNYAAFNAAVLASPVGAGQDALRRRIEVASDYFDSRHVRWTYWLCDDYLEAKSRYRRRRTKNERRGPGLQRRV